MGTLFRQLTPVDRLLCYIDQGLKSSHGVHDSSQGSGRPVPTPAAPTDPAAGPVPGTAAGRHAAGLMRVNHAGEVAAQALYHGQALVARDQGVREFMLQAAREEGDHLAWCAERLRALQSRPSVLNPLWFAGSLAIGALAGLAGDRISLGFLSETERQVEGHLDEHLERLPPEDAASRAILEQMKADEIRHGAHARERGAATLPAPARALMRLTAKAMTTSAYWI
jgi:3-demethoxyubiquinol 3-hydroxylase